MVSNYVDRSVSVKAVIKIAASLCVLLFVLTLTACGSDGGEAGEPSTVSMPDSSAECLEMGWSPQDARNYFEALGFSDIKEEKRFASDDEGHFRDVLDVKIASGFSSEEGWEKGDMLDVDDPIYIYVNKEPPLTVENCDDLASILNGSGFIKGFADEYDERYVSFDAYVSYNIYSVLAGRIVNVSNENYEYNESHGLTIRLSNAGGYEVGERVHVKGQVSRYKTEYYGRLYIKVTSVEKIV